MLRSESNEVLDYNSGESMRKLSRVVSKPDSLGTFNLDTGSQSADNNNNVCVFELHPHQSPNLTNIKEY